MKFKSYFLAIISALFICFFYSCQLDLDFANESECEVYNLIFDVPCPGFAEDGVTRATGSSWQEGDQIFIRFSSTVYGTGVYSKGDWAFTPSSKLHNIVGAQCSIYYFKGKNVTSNGEKVTFDANTCVYSTKTALYSYNNGDLVVSATLTPMVSRIRFKGENGSKIKVSSNFLQYNSYSFNSDELSSAPCNMTLTVNTNGYTDYLYVTVEEDIQLSLDIKFYNFAKSFKKSFFVSGLSGMIQIPTESIYDGWKKKELPRAVLLNGSSFNQAIQTLAGTAVNAFYGDKLIKKIVVKCNTQVTTETLVSRNNSSIPVYASFSNGVITLYTSAEDIYVDNPSEMFYNLRSLVEIDMSKFDFQNVTSTEGMFSTCESLKSIDLSNLNTANVTDMTLMFYKCKELASLDLSHFDTSNVKRMSNMFNGCMELTSLDLSHFDTSNVTDMSYMFRDCSGFTSIDVSNFDTSNVTNMMCMFANCSSLKSLDVSNFDTSNVTNMEGMFMFCSGLTSLNMGNKFIINSGTNIRIMCRNLADSSKFCIIKCTQNTKSKLLSGNIDNINFISSYISWNIL